MTEARKDYREKKYKEISADLNQSVEDSSVAYSQDKSQNLEGLSHLVQDKLKMTDSKADEAKT